MKKTVGLGVMALALSGCGSDSADDGHPKDIAGHELAGKVGGASWTFASASTDAFLSDDQKFWVDVYGQAMSACSGPGSGDKLILSVPKTPGTYGFNLSLNGTFVIDGTETQNLIATQGTIRVDAITDTSVRGGVTMTYDAANSVSGEFEATICPSR